MENGDGFVMMQVSGILRDQKLLVDNWDIQMNMHLVSEMCPEITKSKAFLVNLNKKKLIGLATVDSQNGSRRLVTLSDCNGPGLAECMVTPSDSCNSFVRLLCNTG